jgi:hypothetical protein
MRTKKIGHRGRNRRYLKYMRQSVAITGLGSHMFSKNIEAINTIQSLFSREFREHALIDWTPSTFQNMDSIDISNRYFIDSRDSSQLSPVELHPSIDPTGRLKSLLASSDFIHTEENQVQYYDACPSSGK